jgi:hypothetical protein
MNISEDNKEILKSLSGVTEQVWFQSDTLAVSTTDRQMAVFYDYGVGINIPAKKGETAPTGFGVYNIGELLSLLDTYDKPQVIEKEDRLVIKEGKTSNKFNYTAENCITKPPDDTFEDMEKRLGEVVKTTSTFTLSTDDLKKIMKQSTIIKSKHILFENNLITCTDMDNSSVNTFTFELDSDVKAPRVFISSEKFQKLIATGYTVRLNEKLVVFESTEKKLTYVILGLSE